MNIMRIAILAPFGDFASSYSLSHVVVGQASGLIAAGHDVEIWCMNTVKPDSALTYRIASAVRPCIRPQQMVSDRTTAERAGSYGHDLMTEISRFQPDAIITHDVMFQSSYIDLARAVHEIADNHECRTVKWFHLIHSVFDSGTFDAHNHYRYRIPSGHNLIYPNTSHAAALAHRYCVPQSSVFTCPNPRDPRQFWNVLDLTARIIAKFSLLTRDVVQIYPFCMTRYIDKGVVELVQIFECMAKHADVALVLADANSNTEQAMTRRASLRALAPMLGDRLIFLSEFDPETRSATPNAVVAELFRVSNLFVFPSKGEAGPLVLAEASMSGVHVVLNSNVPAMREYAHAGASFISLGSGFEAVRHRTLTRQAVTTTVGTQLVRTQFESIPASNVIETAARRIYNEVKSNPVLSARTHAFRTYSNDAVAARLLEILAAGTCATYDLHGVLTV